MQKIQSDNLFITQNELVENPSHSFFCPRFKGRFFINLKTNSWFPCNCNAYECPQCGKYKQMNLKKYIAEYINKWTYLRMWTFTYRTGIFNSTEHCLKKTSQIWKNFITYVRRSKELSSAQKKTIYIKVAEVTKRGYVHYHVLFGGYLPIKLIRGYWNQAIRSVISGNYLESNVMISIDKKMEKKKAANYITKYVGKAMQSDLGKLRKWSKSEKVKIFPERVPNPDVICTELKNLEIILKSNSITSQKVEIFDSEDEKVLMVTDENGEIMLEIGLPSNKIEKVVP